MKTTDKTFKNLTIVEIERDNSTYIPIKNINIYLKKNLLKTYGQKLKFVEPDNIKKYCGCVSEEKLQNNLGIDNKNNNN